ncbi:hypothetical protein SAMN04488021_1388 [Paracoccus aminovorans]|uniref:Uncharacterized protein n=1 Tax=Paracoccus aminovorans TaxID=34004 RepID=A0A1I3DFL4_9RHOB|nr:hypothetical protein SAMN04488021_1388 [Paracoccus aminovorans]
MEICRHRTSSKRADLNTPLSAAEKLHSDRPSVGLTSKEVISLRNGRLFPL